LRLDRPSGLRPGRKKRSSGFSAWRESSWLWPKRTGVDRVSSPSCFYPEKPRFLHSILEFLLLVVYFRKVMRLNKNQIEHMAFIVVRNLTKEGKVLLEDKNKIIDQITSLITEEFQKEDQLDQEVREILSKHMEKIRKDNIEYQTMFRMIKNRLAKERNMVL
jgi:hypothetical protein